jgi:hypothetical protein
MDETFDHFFYLLFYRQNAQQYRYLQSEVDPTSVLTVDELIVQTFTGITIDRKYRIHHEVAHLVNNNTSR